VPARKKTVRRKRSETRLQRELRKQRSLQAVIESISGELDLRPLLTRIVHSACELLDAHHGTIGLLDEGRQVIRTEAGYNMPPNELGAEMAPGVGIAGQVMLKRKPVVVRRYGDLPNPTQTGMLENSVVGMPVLWRGRMIGFFGIGRSSTRLGRGRIRPPKPFNQDEVETLEAFARHAAIAIQNARQYRAEQQRAERLALITRVGQIITSELRLDDMLAKAADAVHDVLGYPNVAIALISHDDPGVLVIRVFGGSYRSLIGGEHRLPISKGIIGAAVRSQEVVLVNDVTHDPRYVAAPGVTGIYAEIAVPLLLGSRCLGVLNVESAHALTHEDAESLRVLADQLAVAIENSRLHSAARQLAVIDERHRLARELHDSVTQLLFSITLIAQSLGNAWKKDPALGEKRVERLLELSQAALAEMRALLAELRSAAAASTRARQDEDERLVDSVRRLGLIGAIERQLDSSRKDGIHASFDAGSYVPLPAPTENALFRIAQEALHNVVKHANARHVGVALEATPNGVRLTVRDDGKGLAPHERRVDLPIAAPDGGLGLVFMRERAESLGGTLRIRSSARGGTWITAELPVPKGGGIQK
jgi:signal transduction histidine kinase